MSIMAVSLCGALPVSAQQVIRDETVYSVVNESILYGYTPLDKVDGSYKKSTTTRHYQDGSKRVVNSYDSRANATKYAAQSNPNQPVYPVYPNGYVQPAPYQPQYIYTGGAYPTSHPTAQPYQTPAQYNNQGKVSGYPATTQNRQSASKATTSQDAFYMGEPIIETTTISTSFDSGAYWFAGANNYTNTGYDNGAAAYASNDYAVDTYATPVAQPMPRPVTVRRIVRSVSTQPSQVIQPATPQFVVKPAVQQPITVQQVVQDMRQQNLMQVQMAYGNMVHPNGQDAAVVYTAPNYQDYKVYNQPVYTKPTYAPQQLKTSAAYNTEKVLMSDAMEQAILNHVNSKDCVMQNAPAKYLPDTVSVSQPVKKQYVVQVDQPVVYQRDLKFNQPVIVRQPVVVQKPLVVKQDITVEKQPTYIDEKTVYLKQPARHVQEAPVTVKCAGDDCLNQFSSK